MIKASTRSGSGFSWLHQTVSDLDFEAMPAVLIHGQVITNITDFFNGGGAQHLLIQGFPSSPEARDSLQYARRLCRRRLEGHRSPDRFLEPAAGKLRQSHLRPELLLASGDTVQRLGSTRTRYPRPTTS